ncbi:MAG: DUF2971 domain-containing protein [Campylobacteraceae bacterium]|nr:DUF2971 domain-containing protein [Campylobacteraceae bacterium]
MKYPKKIYKYEPMTIQSIINLKAQAIYFNSPLNFNDPFDCNMELKLRVPYIDELPYILKFLRTELKGSDKLKEIENLPDGELSAIGIVLIEDFLKKSTVNTYNTKGVCCFSETNDNLLMWSHYSSSAKGFCLEFDCSHNNFGKILPVKYVKNPPTVDFKRIFSMDRMYFLKTLLCTKSDHWKYEKEWRSFHNEVNKVYHYSLESLTGVYFGPEIDQDFLEIICLILQGQHPAIKFYKGTLSPDLYKVDFKEVKYTPHILINKI